MAKEAVRVLKLSPKWQPGLFDNHYVRTTFTVPISFTLSKEPNGDDAGKVYNMVDKQPGFPGGSEAFSKYLSNTIRYPKEDRENGTSGRVICTFIVETDGTLTGVKSVRSPSETMAKEAVRVMMSSPKWTPGYKDGRAVRVSFTVPISFQMEVQDEGYKRAKERSADSLLKSPTSPLYILDGEIMKTQPGVSPFNTILKSEDIASMEILKDETATKRYGERGKNGVILITTKAKKTPAKP